MSVVLHDTCLAARSHVRYMLEVARRSERSPGVTVGEVAPTDPPSAMDYRDLPEPIALEDMITTQVIREAPDPTMGRDTETEFVLRHAGG
jgi:hypothetical protein